MKFEARIQNWKENHQEKCLTSLILRIEDVCTKWKGKFERILDRWIEAIQGEFSVKFGFQKVDSLSKIVASNEEIIMKSLKNIEKLYLSFDKKQKVFSKSNDSRWESLKGKSLSLTSATNKMGFFSKFKNSSTNFGFQSTNTVSQGFYKNVMNKTKKQKKQKPVFESREKNQTITKEKIQDPENKILNYLYRKNQQDEKQIRRSYEEKLDKFKEEIDGKMNKIIEFLEQKNQAKKQVKKQVKKQSESNIKQAQFTPYNSSSKNSGKQGSSIMGKEVSKIIKKEKRMKQIKENAIENDIETTQIQHQNYNKKEEEKRKKIEGKQELFIEFLLVGSKIKLPINETLINIFNESYEEECKQLGIEGKKIVGKSEKVQNKNGVLKDSLAKLEKLLGLKSNSEKEKKIENYVEKCVSCVETFVLKNEIPDSSPVQRRLNKILSAL